MRKFIYFLCLAALPVLLIHGCGGGGGSGAGMAVVRNANHGSFGYVSVKAQYPESQAAAMRAGVSLETTIATFFKITDLTAIESVTDTCETCDAPKRVSYLEDRTDLLPYGKSFRKGNYLYTFAGIGIFDYADGEGLVKCMAGEKLVLLMAMKDSTGTTQQLGITPGIKVTPNAVNEDTVVNVYNKEQIPDVVLSRLGILASEIDIADAMIVPRAVATSVQLPSRLQAIIPDYTRFEGLIEDDSPPYIRPDLSLLTDVPGVYGTVRDSVNGLPVVGAGVFLVGSDGLGSVTVQARDSHGSTYECTVNGADFGQASNGLGYYEFLHIPPDTYDLVIIRDNFEYSRTSVVVD